MKPTLVVMAAGMGSRYGGLKQIDPVGPAGEIVIDYSVWDAIHAGFGKIVFVIRKDIERAMREMVDAHFAKRIRVDFVFQDLDLVPAGTQISRDRTKPWGTGHAILCCRDAVREPFGVINADDFYGRDAFVRLASFLERRCVDDTAFTLIGYRLSHTLSDHGAVSRGVCVVDAKGRLGGMVERTRIIQWPNGIVAEEGPVRVPLPGDTVVSMNMWGFTPALFGPLDRQFREFLARKGGDPKSEFFIPSVIDAMVKNGSAEVDVVTTNSHWLGMTYPEDRETVRAGIRSHIAKGEYGDPLW